MKQSVIKNREWKIASSCPKYVTEQTSTDLQNKRGDQDTSLQMHVPSKLLIADWMVNGI